MVKTLLSIIRFICTLTLLTIILITCTLKSSQKKETLNSNNNAINAKSRVSSFKYGGFGDNLYAILEGKIMQLDRCIKTSDSLSPIPNAVIVSFNSNQKPFNSAFSDSTGLFKLEFPKGTFSLIITKGKHQPLVVANYQSEPDQISEITIILEKGDSIQKFELPNRESN